MGPERHEATTRGDRVAMPKPSEIIEIRVSDPPLQLAIRTGAFRPNPTTVRFARAIRIEPGETVFDIGCGIGPLAIRAARDGAGRVVAVDPVPLHCDLARENAEKYGFADLIEVHCGRFFEPFAREPVLRGVKADVIVGDVSGIADPVARALGWYGPDVPAGGPDGPDVMIGMLEGAAAHLHPAGRLYFPIAVDLSAHEKIEAAAAAHFERIENALPKPYVTFPLAPEEVEAIRAAYDGDLPDHITLQTGSRPHWRGQILVAQGPRSTA